MLYMGMVDHRYGFPRTWLPVLNDLRGKVQLDLLCGLAELCCSTGCSCTVLHGREVVVVGARKVSRSEEGWRSWSWRRLCYRRGFRSSFPWVWRRWSSTGFLVVRFMDLVWRIWMGWRRRIRSSLWRYHDSRISECFVRRNTWVMGADEICRIGGCWSGHEELGSHRRRSRIGLLLEEAWGMWWCLRAKWGRVKRRIF